METTMTPEGWTHELADWSVGITSDLIVHDECADSDIPTDWVTEEFIRKERVDDFTSRWFYRWKCGACGAMVEVDQTDFDPIEEPDKEGL